ncbi:hypothetical protein PARPLA_00477 [Rhodobacteraceae bacterium THAF1]|uniref:DUF1127 domain-containing protein n=1 Tax=Palleronia sp. THAF1 TaxID=2587842 RepID=UPI000F3DCFFA|nr:DUF1127 domain-containing protein [Palleronia sp. THAF1]QFU09960.1 hypothetical protein FIU81_14875 [Palleronia sp. THAF1]VDC17135.1 hypothetical protein PARPLA_00477 [Rhodobacteraceae bacterium THAF1]
MPNRSRIESRPTTAETERWKRYRKTVATLEALDDSTLADIGIKRGDIHARATAHAWSTP